MEKNRFGAKAFLSRKKYPISFDLGLGKRHFLRYAGVGNYFYGFEIERAWYTDQYPLDLRTFDKMKELEKFKVDSAKMEPKIRNFVIDALANFG